MTNEPVKWIKDIRNILILLAIVFCFAFFPALLPLLAKAFTPLLIGLVLAFLVDIPASFFERKVLKKAKRKRGFSIVLAVLSVLVVLALIGRLVVPQFVACIQTFLATAPDALTRFLANPKVQQLIPGELTDKLLSIDWNTLSSYAGRFLLSGLSGTASKLSSVFSQVVAIVFGLVFSIYLLAGKERILRFLQRLLTHFLHDEQYVKLCRFFRIFDDSARKYAVGQCTEAVILGCLCALGLLLFKMPYAVMIGALVGLTSLIPVVGAFVGAAMGALMILSAAPEKTILFLIFFIVLQQLEGNLIYPRVVGSSVGIPGILILAAVTVGGALFGLAGMLLFVPMCAAVYRYLKGEIGDSGPTEEWQMRKSPASKPEKGNDLQ